MRRAIFMDVVGVLAGAIVLLGIAGRSADLSRFHVGTWNDQVGYISVARNLLETGTLSSNIIYTSTLNQKATKNYLYMPGHYLALALSFAVGGVGPVQAVIPSLLCYVLSCVCVYLTGLRLYSRAAGLLAAGLFAIYPANIAFSFTAMSELTLVAAVCVAFCLFVWLPPLLRPCLGPLLLVLPFCFRETGALVVIPMAGLVLGGVPLLQRIPWDRWRATGIFCLLSMMLLAYLLMSPLCGGRPSLLKANVFDAGEAAIYRDAFASARLPKRNVAWVRAIRSNTWKNITQLGDVARSYPVAYELTGVLLIWIGTIGALAHGWRRRDAATLSIGVLGLAISFLLFTLYAISYSRGLRMLMFIWPLLAIAVGAWLAQALIAQRPVWLRPQYLAAVGAIFLGAGYAQSRQGIHYIAYLDKSDDLTVKLIDSLGHNPQRMLVSPSWFGPQYAAARHPVKWGFLPENAKTLALLNRKFDVGTMVIAPNSISLNKAQIKAAGFVFDQRIRYYGQVMLVYKRPAALPAGVNDSGRVVVVTPVQ